MWYDAIFPVGGPPCVAPVLKISLELQWGITNAITNRIWRTFQVITILAASHLLQWNWRTGKLETGIWGSQLAARGLCRKSPARDTGRSAGGNPERRWRQNSSGRSRTRWRRFHVRVCAIYTLCFPSTGFSFLIVSSVKPILVYLIDFNLVFNSTPPPGASFSILAQGVIPNSNVVVNITILLLLLFCVWHNAKFLWRAWNFPGTPAKKNKKRNQNCRVNVNAFCEEINWNI